jgi:hypothetical protein
MFVPRLADEEARPAGDRVPLVVLLQVSSAVRRHAGSCGPAPPFLGPLRDQCLVGSRQAAQVRCASGEWLVELPIARALEDPGDLGEQVGPACGDLAERGLPPGSR